MELKEALLKRRSVRKFTDESVSDEMIEELKGASKFTKMSSKLAFVVYGNLLHALPIPVTSYWIQDCSAAIENILLRVTDLGLGAVWCGLHPQKGAEERTRKILDIPKTQVPLGLILIGHPAEEPEARDQFDEKRVYYIR